MIKRFLFYTLCLALVCLGVYRVYDEYRVEDIDPVAVSKINYDLSEAYSIEGINSIITALDAESSINILFYVPDDVNSIYMFNVTLSSIMNERNMTTLENIYFVNISGLSDEAQRNLKSKYGFSTAPAFVNLSFSDGSTTINSAIQEDTTTLLSHQTVENWLAEHGIIEAVDTE